MLSLVLLVHLGVCLLFMCGAIPSFTLKVENVSIPGLALYAGFLACFTVIVFALTRDVGPRQNELAETLAGIDYRRANLVIDLLLAVTVAGCAAIFFITIGGYSISDYLMACISNDVRTNEDLEEGPFHLFIVFPMVCAPLLAISAERIPRPRLKILLVVLLAAYLGAVFGSRLVLFEVVFALLVAAVRARWYEVEFTLKTLLAIVALVAVLALIFVFVSGNRDYEDGGGYLYTNSVWVWGISRALDYPLSTAIYASHALELANPYSSIQVVFPTIARFFSNSNEGELFEFVNAFRSAYGQAYYTNMSGIGQLIESCGVFSPLVASVCYCLSAYLFKRFDSGELVGLLVYPYILYTLFETWRTFYFFSETTQVVVVCLLLCSWFITRGDGESEPVKTRVIPCA